MVWIVLGLMTAAVTAALLLPVLKWGARTASAGRNAYDRAVFRDQLAELERDAARGMIGPSEAEAARNEIARRLIAVSGDDTGKAGAAGAAPWAALALAALVPLLALPLYLKSGSPGIPDVPRAARIAEAEIKGDFDALIVKVEEHLAKNPDDLEGWKVLAPNYSRAMRWNDAAEAYRNIMRLQPPDAANIAAYGEAMVMANQGLVPAAAHEQFRKALALDPKLPVARFYDALALKQEGKTAEAKAAFESFLKDSPEDAPWRQMLVAELQDLSARPPALDAETMKDAAAMSAGDQQAMIRTMVDGLEERLASSPDDLGGWLRLMRARAVLGETDKAKAAYDRATAQFAGNAEALAQLAGLAREMKIE